MKQSLYIFLFCLNIVSITSTNYYPDTEEWVCEFEDSFEEKLDIAVPKDKVRLIDIDVTALKGAERDYIKHIVKKKYIANAVKDNVIRVQVPEDLGEGPSDNNEDKDIGPGDIASGEACAPPKVRQGDVCKLPQKK